LSIETPISSSRVGFEPQILVCIQE